MQLLNSNNYDKVSVYIRGLDAPIDMPASGGIALMNFLTTDTTSQSHVMLTDTKGRQTVINRHQIQRVEPWEKTDLFDLSKELLP
jgi:hypothetical protein